MYIFLCFIFFVSKFSCEQHEKVFRIKTEVSMFMPAVGDNGLSLQYEFLGDNVITSMSNGPTGVKMGYNGVPSSAGVISKHPIENKPFRIDVRFSVKKGTKGDGIAFWITPSNEFQKGNVYGREPVDGLLIAIDFKGQYPFIGINHKNTDKITNFHKTQQIQGEFFNMSLSLRILYENDSITVYLGRNNKFSEIFQLDNYTLPEQTYFAISTKHTTGFSPTFLYAIRYSNIEYPSFKGGFEEERQSKRGWVWIFFLLGLVALFVTVGKKQFDNFKKNN